MTEHKEGLKVYFTIFGILMLLTAVTVVAAYVDLGRMNTFIALAIAGFKGTLVILYFMHVRHSERLIWVWISAGFYFLVLIIAITMADYIGRLLPL